jgi:hypothetical protein
VRDEADVGPGVAEGQGPTAGWARGGFGLSVYGDATPSFVRETNAEEAPARGGGRALARRPVPGLDSGPGASPPESAKGSKRANPASR